MKALYANRTSLLSVCSVVILLSTISLFAFDKSGVKPTTVVLPDGPGAVQGLGESFEPALNTGTAKYSIPLSLPPGTAGHAPSLALSYDSGRGDGPLGTGWFLPLPFIQRQTDKGLPRYVDATNGVDDDLDGSVDNVEELDRLITEVSEELVPVTNGWYFCEVESSFIRYRRVDSHWEGTRPDGTQLIFGSNTSARVTNADTGHVFRWLLEQETDTCGNTITYTYSTNAGTENLNQTYLRTVAYGPGRPPRSAFHQINFLYGIRPDVVEDCRAGFPVRTGLLLTNVVVSTAGLALPGHVQMDANGDEVTESLNRVYRLTYTNQLARAFLTGVTQFGCDGQTALPVLSFSYGFMDAAPPAAPVAVPLAWESPWSLDNPLVELADLNGDALPDLLKTASGGAHQGIINRGGGWSAGVWQVQSGAPAEVASADGLAWNIDLADENKVAHLADIDGDGSADLWYQTAAGSAFYFQNTCALAWGVRTPLSVQDTPPPAPFSLPTVKTADLNGDKRIDIVQSIDVGGVTYYRIWFNLGDDRYTRSFTVPLEDGVPLSLAGVSFGEWNGDGVIDLLRVREAVVEVRVGLGHGRFTSCATVPIPSGPLGADALSRATLQDINGDGRTDLIVTRPVPGTLWYWLNADGAMLAEHCNITGMPTVTGTDVVERWADLNGNGSTDYILSGTDQSPRIQSVDLMLSLGLAPDAYLLTGIDNGIGLRTRIAYQSSTADMLVDWGEGTAVRAWPDPLPFPVTVIREVRSDNTLGTVTTNRYRYHDGYYDGAEKEFRGFARVTVAALGDASAPTLVSRSLFDTGRDHEAMKGKLLQLTTEDAEHPEGSNVFSVATTAWAEPPRLLHTGLDGREVRFAHPVASSNVIMELGRGTPRVLYREQAFDDYGNQTLDANYGIVEGGDRSAFDDERIVTNCFAINTDAWVVHAPSQTEIIDEIGLVLSRTVWFYDDPTFSGTNPGQVITGLPTLVREWINASDPTNHVDSKRVRYDDWGNPCDVLDPLASAPGGVIDYSWGHTRSLTYDATFHALPVTETVHLEAGKPDLVYRAAYDVGLGVVTQAWDFNCQVTAFGYDPLARLSSIARPGDLPDFPSLRFDYALGQLDPDGGVYNAVRSLRLDRTPGTAGTPDDHYLHSRTFVDGAGRTLLKKTEAEKGHVAVSEAVILNTRGKPAALLAPYFTCLSGTLEQRLAFESPWTLGWTGVFHLNGTNVTCDLATSPTTAFAYDATLRETRTVHPDGARRCQIYEPLSTVFYDENDTDPEAPAYDTPRVEMRDGLQRLVSTEEHVRLRDDGSPSDDLRIWSTRFAYDLNDNLVLIEDAQGNVRTFGFDGLKRRIYLNDPDRGELWWTFDAAGNVLETIDAKLQRIVITYDGANRLLTEDYLDEAQPFSAGYAFDPSLPLSAANRPDVANFYDHPHAAATLPDGLQASNTLGRLVSVLDLAGAEHTAYDARGNETWVCRQVRDPLVGTLTAYTTRTDYDAADRPARLTYPDGDWVRVEYGERGLLARAFGDLTGDLVSDTDYSPSGAATTCRYGNGITATSSFDRRGRLGSLAAFPGGTPSSPLLSLGYRFDAASNITGIDDLRTAETVPAGDPRRNTQRFLHDDLSRLTGVTYSFDAPDSPLQDSGNIAYRYDRIGNMLEQSSSIDQQENGLPVADLGEMHSGGSSGTSNRHGRAPSDPPGPHALTSIDNPQSAITNRQYSYDANGNMLNIDGLVCTWDFRDRLAAVERRGTNGTYDAVAGVPRVTTGIVMRAVYAYDYTGRRITKTVETPSLEGERPRLEGESPREPETTVYVNRFYEVRDRTQPVKYLFNGETRVARITGTLSDTVRRTQHLPLHAGWNLCALRVNGTLAPDQSDGLACYRWVGGTQNWERVESGQSLPAGEALWVESSTNRTWEVTGTPVTTTNLLVQPPGAFVGVAEATAPCAVGAGDLWRHPAGGEPWRVRFSGDLATASTDYAISLSPGEAAFLRCATNTVLSPSPEALAIRYYLQDHLGSTALILDADGSVVEEVAHYPYGYPRHTWRPAGIRESYGFTQKEQDEESGLHYFEARYLVSNLGRFASVDPVVFFPTPSSSALNTEYCYAINRPLVVGDPTGNNAIGLFNEGVKVLPVLYDVYKLSVINLKGHSMLNRAKTLEGWINSANRTLDKQNAILNENITGSNVHEIKKTIGILQREINTMHGELATINEEAQQMVRAASALESDLAERTSTASIAEAFLGPVLEGAKILDKGATLIKTAKNMKTAVSSVKSAIAIGNAAWEENSRAVPASTYTGDQQRSLQSAGLFSCHQFSSAPIECPSSDDLRVGR